MLQCLQSHRFQLFSPSGSVFLTHWSVHVLKQHQPVSRAALRSQHSSHCQLKSHQKAQGNIRRWILPVKDTEKGSSKAWWCTQSADTHSQCVWGGLWAGGAGQTERGGSGGAGWAGQERLHLSCQSDQPGLVGALTGISPGPTSQLWHCQLPCSQVLSTLQELSPSARQQF